MAWDVAIYVVCAAEAESNVAIDNLSTPFDYLDLWYTED